ncbi:MAG: hypothetical protein DMG35_06265 [Acidobacteria bacterium]|nr:MAG: hypothetical protein DMG35_06265 [Acidobacteriota bacterium]
MIVCVSANPAVDKRVRLPKLALGRVNRVSHVQAAAGGKSAHVAMALRALGSVPRWIGFAGGATGQELLAGLKDLDISSVTVPMKNATRVNLEIIDEDGNVTEILELGLPFQHKNVAHSSRPVNLFSAKQGTICLLFFLAACLPASYRNSTRI